jgi:hypothetical protein
MLIAGYQDVRYRLVSDMAWIPGIIGGALVFLLSPQISLILLVRLALVGLISYAFARHGSIGYADGIALVIVSVDPFPLTPIPMLLAGGAVALIHIAYLYFKGLVGKSKVIPLEQFKREARWIPKAMIKDGIKSEVERDVNISRERVEANSDGDIMVEVQYGVPTVSYIAMGYLLYLIYLAIFQPSILSLA